MMNSIQLDLRKSAINGRRVSDLIAIEADFDHEAMISRFERTDDFLKSYLPDEDHPEIKALGTWIRNAIWQGGVIHEMVASIPYNLDPAKPRAFKLAFNMEAISVVDNLLSPCMAPEAAANALAEAQPDAHVSIDSLAVASAVNGALKTSFWTEDNKRSQVSYHGFLVPDGR